MTPPLAPPTSARVIDLNGALAGPHAAMLLADLAIRSWLQ